MASKYWKICGIRLFGGDEGEVLNLAERGVAGRPYWIATVNPEFVMEASKDRQFLDILQKTDLNVVDGVALFWAKEVGEMKDFWSRLGRGWQAGWGVLRGEYHGRVVRGSELMVDLASQTKRVFLLGGWGSAAEKTGDFLKRRFGKNGLQLMSCEGEPRFGNEEVLEKISKFRPELLLVAYGMVKQEKWIGANYKSLKKAGVRVVMGVGRSFDYYSGNLKRAPEKWRRMGLEWLYSLIQEPKRWRRQLALPKFVWRTLRGVI